MTVSPIRWEASPSLQLYCPEYQGGASRCRKITPFISSETLQYFKEVHRKTLLRIPKRWELQPPCLKMLFFLCQVSNQVRGYAFQSLQGYWFICKQSRLSADMEGGRVSLLSLKLKTLQMRMLSTMWESFNDVNDVGEWLRIAGGSGSETRSLCFADRL